MALSSLVSDLHFSNLLQNDNLHLFGRAPPDISSLTQLLDRTNQLSASLRRSYLAFDPEPRIVSLLKEHTSHSKIVEDAQRESSEYVKTLERLRSESVRYGEDIPLSRDSLPDYVLNQIVIIFPPESNTAASGLEVYKDGEPNKMVFTCGGKLLVLDMTFLVNHSAETIDEAPIILDSLHISHAPAPGEETRPQSAAAQAAADHLPALLSDLIKVIIQESLAYDTVPDGQLIALLWRRYRSHLRYLVFLDALAASGSTYGLRWLREANNIAEHVEALSVQEMKGLSLSTSSFPANLDVLLRRGHPVPLPHLICPSLSFLISVSPRFYLSLLRNQDVASKPVAFRGNNYDAMMDVDSSSLRRLLMSCLNHQLHSTKADPTARDEDLFAVANLHLARTHSYTPSSPPNAPVTVSAAPTVPPVSFQLLPQSNTHQVMNEHANPQHYNIPEVAKRTISYEIPIESGVQWVLDLQMCSLPNRATASDRSEPRGIWLRQSAAAAIAKIVGVSLFNNENLQMLQGMPVITDEVHDPLGLGVNIGYPTGPRTPKYSWFDYLAGPNNPISAVKYRTSSESRPSVRASYVPPNEPGFHLRHVPVVSLRQAYAVLEILRDELWIIELFKSVQWEPDYEHPHMNESYVAIGVQDVGEEEIDLDSLLNGTYIPSSIPCTIDVLYPSYSISSPETPRATVQAVFPLPPPSSPLASVTVSHDLHAPLGIRALVNFEGSMSSVDHVSKFQERAEEFLRRGGGLKIVRWIWERSRSLASGQT